MKISFVIPAYNEEAYLGGCLEALCLEIHREAGSFKTEMIVVNNASTDKTREIAKRFAGVSIIEEPKKGVALARQKGLEAAKGDIIAYIDADTKVTPGWIPVMLAEFAADPALVAISGPYIYYDLPAFWRRLAWPYHLVVGGITEFFTGQWVFGGNFAARRSALSAIGGFDTSILFYGEDQNVVQRLKKVGRFKFCTNLRALSSARRFVKEGIIKTVLVYAFNFIWVTVFKYPPNMVPRDVR
ncbi:glycosyltransferase family 2 protein [Candidatus Kaiserbacteria bacterium]|nr:glycosyltransferase family 2 protein [Candidatus Kaiserbacteria bacterium]